MDQEIYKSSLYFLLTPSLVCYLHYYYQFLQKYIQIQ